MSNKIVRSLVAVSLAAVAVTLIPAVRAGEKKEEKKHAGQEYFEGKVSAIDFKAKTVTIAKKEGNMIFAINDATKCFVEGKKDAAKLDDFKVGDKVNVLYKNVNGTLVASRLAEGGSHADEKEKKAK